MEPWRAMSQFWCFSSNKDALVPFLSSRLMAGNGKFSLVLPCSKKTLRLGRNIWGWFLKWWYPTTIGFPAKNDHFRVFGNTHIYSLFTYSLADWSKNPRGVKRIWCFLVPNFTQLFRISKTSPSDGITAHHSNLMPVVLDITPSLPTTLIPKPCNCGKKIISFILLRNLIIICFTKGPLLTFMGTIMDQCFFARIPTYCSLEGCVNSKRISEAREIELTHLIQKIQIG